MKKSLFQKILTKYLLMGLLSIIILSSIGAYYIEKQLVGLFVKNVYDETVQQTEKMSFSSLPVSTQQKILQNNFTYGNNKEDPHIWIFDENGIILAGDHIYPSDFTPEEVLSFEKAIKGNPPYMVTTLSRRLKDKNIIICFRIESAESPKLILLAFPKDVVFPYRTPFHEILFLMLLILFVISLTPLLFYRFSVYKPVMNLVNGVEEFSHGNLEYKIPEHSETVLGYVARSLNFMADRLNKDGQYQRRVLSNISHDFKSPITSIKGYAGAMLDGTIPPEMHDKYLRIIHNEAGRLEKLTGNLNALSNLDQHKRELSVYSFDINKVLKSCGETFEGVLTTNGITLTYIFESEKQPVLADGQRIRQVIYNLLDNAIKFSPPNSTIIIGTSCKNDKVFVSVKDHGWGIKTESLSRIFDRFYKEDTSRGKDRQGTGLGLSIVKEIINAHDENINVISTEGVGTEFIFTLKRDRDEK